MSAVGMCRCCIGGKGGRDLKNREGDLPTCRYALFAVLGSDKYADVLPFTIAQEMSSMAGSGVESSTSKLNQRRGAESRFALPSRGIFFPDSTLHSDKGFK